MKKLKSLLLCLIMLSALMGLGAQTGEWAVRAGGTHIEISKAATVDTEGNCYITGYFFNTVDFGSTTLTSSGDSDIFIAKLDSEGNWLWARSAGGTGSEYPYGIAIDNDGNVYVTGNFTGTSVIGIVPLISAGIGDVFVAKLTTDGTWLWAQRAGGVNNESSESITIDDSGNCYVTGFFWGSATFGTTTLTSAGLDDIFVAKLNTNGLWLWAVRAGGTNGDVGHGITSDGSDGLYVTGGFSVSGDFGTTNLTSAGGYDIFVCKLDENGIWQWAKRAGGSNNDYSYAIATDGMGRIYTTGKFYGEANFGYTSLSSGNNLADTFVARQDENGYWLWAVRGGSEDIDEGLCIAADSNGNIWISGHYYGNPFFGSTYLTNAGGYDVFIAKLDLNSNWLWARRCGGTGADYSYGIGADVSGSCYFAGYFQNTADFGPIQLVSAGSYDIYVAKLSDPTPKIPQNIAISNLGNDVIVDWDAVTLDTWNCSLAPDYYIVYYSSNTSAGPYQYLTFVPANFNQYVHQNAGFFSSIHFYRVTAVKFYLADRSGLEDYLNTNLRQDMTETEVKQVLQRIESEF